MNFYLETIEALRKSADLRRIPADRSGLPLVDLSGNDYLGIAADPELKREFLDSLGGEFPSLSASASRLLASRQNEFSRLERLLFDLYGAPALLFNSGYHANSGCIAALAAGNTLIVADKLVHASIIDGMVLSRARFERFRHNDVDHLRRVLERHAPNFGRVLIVVESVYSMDGDVAPLGAIAELKRGFPNVELYVDEAHAFGVMGRDGLGLSADMADVDFTLGTLGKAAGSEGAFLICRPAGAREYLVNRARSLIFSTAIAPINCAWSSFVIERIPSMTDRRQRLRELSASLGEILHTPEPTHIQPLIIGSSAGAIELSNRLLAEGFQVLPIRTPTVPSGTERLRFSLSANLNPADLTRLKTALARHEA